MSFEEVKQAYGPLKLDDRYPRHWETYTGRGKSIIVDIIKERKLRDMLEVGVFLGASVDFFLNAEDELRIVGCDPWGSGWAGRQCATARYNERYLLDISQDAVDQLQDGDAFHKIVSNGLVRFRDRLVLVRGKFEETGPKLRDMGYRPDLVFLDATKEISLLRKVHEIFPDTILTGDDFLWRDANGTQRMKEVLDQFSDENDFRVVSSHDSWILLPR